MRSNTKTPKRNSKVKPKHSSDSKMLFHTLIKPKSNKDQLKMTNMLLKTRLHLTPQLKDCFVLKATKLA